VNATNSDITRRTPGRLAAGAVAVLAALLLSGAAAADDLPTLGDVTKARAEGARTSVAETPVDDGAAQDETALLAESWGIEVTSIRLTANDHMIDFRYRILDPDKAAELFVRQNKPALIHQETGKVLAVPETAKVGPLRNSDMPQEGKIYWMFFGNAGGLVQRGDKVTVTIGEFRVEDLVVE